MLQYIPPPSPATPPPMVPYADAGLPTGHSTLSKRVHPRTSLQSPYSKRFERSLPKHSESPSPASTLEHYAIKRPASRRCSLPDRHNVAWGYCQKRRPRASTDPAAAAIRHTYADELNMLIESLIWQLERLDIEDHHMIWEHVDVGLDGESCVATYPDMCDGYSPPYVPLYDVAASYGVEYVGSAPGTPLTPSVPLLDYAATCSPESSPAPMTPQLPDNPNPEPWGCPDTYAVTETAIAPAVFEPIMEDPANAPTVDSDDGDDSDDELEAELMALLQASPCPSPRKLEIKSAKGTRSKTGTRRTSVGASSRRRKAISANAVLASLSITSPFSSWISRDKGASSPTAGPSRPTRPSTPPRLPALNVTSVPATPVARRRRAKASDESCWDGFDVTAAPSKRKKSTPYNRPNRTRRKKEKAAEPPALPGCVLSSSSAAAAEPVKTTPVTSKAKSSAQKKPRKCKAPADDAVSSSLTDSHTSKEANETPRVADDSTPRETNESQYFSFNLFDERFMPLPPTDSSNEELLEFLRMAMEDALPDLASIVSAL